MSRSLSEGHRSTTIDERGQLSREKNAKNLVSIEMSMRNMPTKVAR